MTDISATCPCCGQPVEADRVLVDLNTNSISFGGRTVRIHAAAAELMTVLVKAYPATVHHERIIQAIWGQREAPLLARNVVAVRISQMRRRIRDVIPAVQIVPVWGEGYRLVLPVKDRAAA